MEYEPGLKMDIPEALEKIAPTSLPYAHHDTWHDTNGRSHVNVSIMGPGGISLLFKEGTLVHGSWQQILFLELEVHSRQRTIVFQIVGE